jgi:chaperone BCS1
MFSLKSMPSIISVLSAYTTFAAVAMLVRTILNEFKTIASQLIPQKLQENFLSRLEALFGNLSSQMTLIIDEYCGLSINEIYQASEVYLSTRITPSIRQLKVFKTPREKNLSITISKGEKIVDTFEGIHLTWEFISPEKQKSNYDSVKRDSQATETIESRSILLSFSKQYKEKVLDTYLPHVVDRSKAIREEKKALRLYSMGPHFTWKYVHLEHPSTFDTLAMDPKQKKELMDDLDRFVKRREFYRRVGKAWKRGYLLYGPPRTGKSSLIAAMANYLKFDVYDVELTNLRSNSELKRLLTSTPNQSILVIENIDCSNVLQDRKHQERHHFFHGGSSQVSLYIDCNSIAFI